MREYQFAGVALFNTCAALLFFAAAGAAQAGDQNPTPSDHNVYFRRVLYQQGRIALQKACDVHGGKVVTNAEGKIGCQVGSLTDSKNISDGAAKGQANE